MYRATLHRLAGLSAEPAASQAMILSELHAFESKVR